MIDAGLPRGALLRARRLAAKIPTAEFLGALGISQRSLVRFQAEPDKALNADQSERLWRFAKIFAQAKDVFGSEERAIGWIRNPVMALENRKPIELLRTSVGTQLVDDVLERIRQGQRDTAAGHQLRAGARVVLESRAASHAG
jgi:putative toxin-antitoxin system antitoxin component (TIGR02293 family)